MKHNLETLKDAVERFYVVPTRENARACKKEIDGFEKELREMKSDDATSCSLLCSEKRCPFRNAVLGESISPRCVHEHCKRCSKEISLSEARNVRGPGFCYGCWVNHMVECKKILDEKKETS